MIMHGISFLVFILLSLLTSARATDCLIDITQLGVFHPLLLDEVTNEILYPIIGSSIIRLGSNAKFVLACPGTDIQIAGISIGDTEIAMCDSGKLSHPAVSFKPAKIWQI
ncbi:hypothetical protein JTB14_002843 [Gonioctena quinquepunctata]|nr:hypothetical protein JTB14_002843 [Gonioctena quinquepunctata]